MWGPAFSSLKVGAGGRDVGKETRSIGKLLRTRPWYWAAVLLGLLALTLVSAAKGFEGRSGMTIARAIGGVTDGAPATTLDAAGELAKSYLARAARLRVASVAVIGCALFAWMVSMRRHEPGWRFLPPTLFAALLLFDLLLVV